jgi:hypothetical protein
MTLCCVANAFEPLGAGHDQRELAESVPTGVRAGGA